MCPHSGAHRTGQRAWATQRGTEAGLGDGRRQLSDGHGHGRQRKRRSRPDRGALLSLQTLRVASLRPLKRRQCAGTPAPTRSSQRRRSQPDRKNSAWHQLSPGKPLARAPGNRPPSDAVLEPQPISTAVVHCDAAAPAWSPRRAHRRRERLTTVNGAGGAVEAAPSSHHMPTRATALPPLPDRRWPRRSAAPVSGVPMPIIWPVSTAPAARARSQPISKHNRGRR